MKKLFAVISLLVGVLLLAYAIFALRICIIYLGDNSLSQGASLSEYTTEVIMFVATNVLPYLFYAVASCGIGLLLLNKQHLSVVPDRHETDAVVKPADDFLDDLDDADEMDDNRDDE
jgi:hypothetical protein